MVPLPGAFVSIHRRYSRATAATAAMAACRALCHAGCMRLLPRTSCCSSDRGCKAAKTTSAVLLSGLALTILGAVVAIRRRPQHPEPAEAPPRVTDPLR